MSTHSLSPDQLQTTLDVIGRLASRPFEQQSAELLGRLKLAERPIARAMVDYCRRETNLLEQAGTLHKGLMETGQLAWDMELSGTRTNDEQLRAHRRLADQASHTALVCLSSLLEHRLNAEKRFGEVVWPIIGTLQRYGTLDQRPWRQRLNENGTDLALDALGMVPLLSTMMGAVSIGRSLKQFGERVDIREAIDIVERLVIAELAVRTLETGAAQALVDFWKKLNAELSDVEGALENVAEQQSRVRAYLDGKDKLSTRPST
jgi:hypothetical protein